STFIDFREGGYGGTTLLRNIKPEPKPIILGRPLSSSDGTIGIADGAGMSAILDHDVSFLMDISKECRRAGKTFAMHLSERIREDIDAALDLKPDLLVHCLECSDKDLDRIASAGIPVAITPRSNVFFGRKKDYSRFLRHGIPLLLGTDNVMTVEPDMFREMGFIYTWQRSIGRFSPDSIISMATENPWKFINGRGLGTESFQYLFFKGLRLSSYELVSRAHMFRFSFARLIP
ncbi:chlorohydrolase family protein, partial [mine drainage metagenome]